ncbi:hypothetical protein MBLNU13_g02767t1 [Cladosporium sp. NU13]
MANGCQPRGASGEERLPDPATGGARNGGDCIVNWQPECWLAVSPMSSGSNNTYILVPFSVFPSAYKNNEKTEEVKTEEQVTVQGAGREEQQQPQPQQSGPSRHEERIREDIRITTTEDDRQSQRPARISREEEIRIFENDRRDSRREDRFEERREDRFDTRTENRFDNQRFDSRVDVDIQRDNYRQPYQRYSEAQINVEDRTYDREYQNRQDLDARIDAAERDFRERTAPYPEEYNRETRQWESNSTNPRQYPAQQAYPDREPVSFDEQVRVTKTTVDTPSRQHKRDMGYYDEDGHYHSFRHGLHRAADKVLHPIHGAHHHHHHHSHSEPKQERIERVEEDIVIRDREVTTSAPRQPAEYSTQRRTTSRTMIPNTITIPCHHIRIGDLLILQGRPCQVIRITTSAQTGQHRYLGVDLFTKQLHEESSFVSNPSPSVVVQNMLGPVFKQYRVLDIRDDGNVVAMTETGDVKQGLPVLDQSSLLARLTESFNNGRGSVRVLVINDEGRELAVDYKVVHGSRL